MCPVRRTLGVQMSKRNVVVCIAILASVSLASGRVSAQDASQGFTIGTMVKEGVATMIHDGIATTVNLRVPVEAKVVKGAPFSAEIVTESIQTLADGNRIVQRSNTRVYRDSEGRVRREEDRGSKSPVISIIDPVSAMSYSLDPDNRIARQTPNM